jgi:hypothetical protein
MAQALYGHATNQSRPEPWHRPWGNVLPDGKRYWRFHATAALDALLAPSRVPCPECFGDRAVADASDIENFSPCPDCSDGTIEGPSLAEQVLGLERGRAWVDLPSGESGFAPEHCVKRTDDDIRYVEPVYRRHSSESAPGGK